MNKVFAFLSKWGIPIVCIIIAVVAVLSSRVVVNTTNSSVSSASTYSANYNENLNINLMTSEMLSGKKQITYAWLKMSITELTENTMHPMFSSFQYLFMKVLWIPGLMQDGQVLVGVPVLGEPQTNVQRSSKGVTNNHTTTIAPLKWLGL